MPTYALNPRITATRRDCSANETIGFALDECTLGVILVASSDRGVVAILLGDQPDALMHDLKTRFPHAAVIGPDTALAATVAQVIELIETPGVAANLRLDIRGTAFQQRVWQALRAIPPGRTATYAEIARTIGAPAASRAVAGACAANPLAIAIPCHRVIRADGNLSGYRWGIGRKRHLLDQEAA